MAQTPKNPVYNNSNSSSLASHNVTTSPLASHNVNKTSPTSPQKVHQITVSNVNVTLSLNSTKPVRAELKANDTDKNDTLTFYIVRPPKHGNLSAIAGHNVTRQKVFNVTYTPQSAPSSPDSFTYKALDPVEHLSSTNTGTVILDHPPTVSNMKITMNGTKPFKVILAGSDPDKGDKLTFSILQVPLNGQLTNPSGNSSTYSPNSGFLGHDKFTYQAKDRAGVSSNNGTVLVNIGKPLPGLNVTAPGPPTPPSSTLQLTTTVLIYVGIVAGFMLIPLVYDMAKTYKLRGRPGPETTGFPDLARSLMAFGIIIILAILAFHVLVTITYTTLLPATNDALIKIINNLSTILGGAVSAIIGFYFGQRTLERRDTRARAPLVGGPTVIGTVPSDGSYPVPVNTPITGTFGEPVTVEQNSLTLKDANNNHIQGGTVLSNDGKTLTFNRAPNITLIPSTTYIATIAGVKDLAGNPMSSPKTWKFTTAPPAP